MVKNGSEGKASACKVEDLGSIPGSGRSPGTYSSPLAWKIPWVEKPVQTTWGRRESDTTE